MSLTINIDLPRYIETIVNIETPAPSLVGSHAAHPLGAKTTSRALDLQSLPETPGVMAPRHGAEKKHTLLALGFANPTRAEATE